MVFLDSNVPMYLVGAEHANKITAGSVLQKLALQGERIVTDAEVFQEILHRYTAIQRTAAIQPAFDALHSLVDHIFQVDIASVESAKDLVLAYSSLSARDAIHVAVMKANSISTLVSFDSGFDSVPGISRLYR